MFTKKDLKDRMVVETRDGGRYMVAGDRLIGHDGFLMLSAYDDDLCDSDLEDLGGLCITKEGLSPYDIMKVFDVVGDLQIDNIGSSTLFDRRSNKESSKNKDIAKRFCKTFANIYDLDENKLHRRLVHILYEGSDRDVSIIEFDIEKCSKSDICKAMHKLGIECACYHIIKNTEKD